MKMNKDFIKKILIITLSVFFILPILLSIFGYNNIYEGLETPENRNVKTIQIDISTRKPIHIREIEVFNHDGDNIATIENVDVSQSTIHRDDLAQWGPSRAIDDDMATMNHTNHGTEWFRLEFKTPVPITDIHRIVIYNRDSNKAMGDRLIGATLSLYDNADNKFEEHAHTLTGDFEQTYVITAEAPVEEETPDEEEDDTETPVDDGAETINVTCNINHTENPKEGDRLCCGQSGSYNSLTSRMCPAEYPVCSGYKCGEKWGKCQKNT